MGYNTDFIGEFNIDKPVTEEVASLLRGLATTRRMKRDNNILIEAGYGDCGVDGEFFFFDDGNYGQDAFMESVVDSNKPPSTQPSLWCQWLLADDNQTIVWNMEEKFYEYTKWIEYLIEKILAPNGYLVNGSVAFRGDEFDDFGVIIIEDNHVEEYYQDYRNFFSQA